MAGTLDIKRRINSISNTKKVTKAMEVVSAAKMKKAVSRALALRPYAKAMYELFANIAPETRKDHPLLATRKVTNVLVIVIASNKGLCGSYNAMLTKVVRNLLDNSQIFAETKEDKDISIDFITIGKRADHMVKILGRDSIASFPDIVNKKDSESVYPLIEMVFETFEQERYDKVAVVYTDYINAISQKQKIRQLLPVSRDDLEKQLVEMDNAETDKKANLNDKIGYLIEPSVEVVLEKLVPRVVESQILHALYESAASEESSRMIAMKNATDAANEIVDNLKLTYNKMRQSKITQEISEISAGRAALE